MNCLLGVLRGYEFMKYVATLQLKLHQKDIPSLQTVARDVIGIYNREREREREREKLSTSLKDFRVCLITDIWTYSKFISYVSHVTSLMMLESCMRKF